MYVCVYLCVCVCLFVCLFACLNFISKTDAIHNIVGTEVCKLYKPYKAL